MASSLIAFRTQYLEGRLISDLVTIQDGQYVVRARVELAGETISTGMAASADVQIAEDKARERAIAALGIGEGGKPPKSTKSDGAADSEATTPGSVDDQTPDTAQSTQATPLSNGHQSE